MCTFRWSGWQESNLHQLPGWHMLCALSYTHGDSLPGSSVNWISWCTGLPRPASTHQNASGTFAFRPHQWHLWMIRGRVPVVEIFQQKGVIYVASALVEG